MPSISQLPGTIQAVSTADILILAQGENGDAVQASLAAILDLVPNQTAGTTIPGLPSGTSPTTGNDVVMVQSGTAALVPYDQTINALTISELPTAAPVAGTDTVMVGQNSDQLKTQSFAAILSWIQSLAPTVKTPVIELTTNTTLSAVPHQGSLLVASQSIVVTPNIALMGSGFSCTILAVGGAVVTFGSGFLTSSGSLSLASGVLANVIGFTYSGGSIAFANITTPYSGSGVVPLTPTNLAAGSTTNTTVPLTWTVASGATSYDVQWSVHNGNSWTATAATSSSSLTVTGLSPNTEYDFQVNASNIVGTSSWSSTVSATTTQITAPGVPTNLAAGTPTSTTVPLTWSAPASGGTVATYTVQWSVHSANSWTQITGISGTSQTVTDLSSSTEYDFEVLAVNAGGSSAYTSAVNATTTSGGYSYTLEWGNLAPTSPVSHTGSWNGGGLDFSSTTTPPTGATGWIAYSNSGTVLPTTGYNGPMSAGSSGGGNPDGFGMYISPPSSAGTWYVWAILEDASGTVIAALASSAITVT